MSSFRNLTSEEINHLISNGCSSENWDLIKVSPDFLSDRVRSTHLLGKIVIGKNNGLVQINGTYFPCLIRNATLNNCQIGDNVFISNVGSIVQNYVIEDNVIIEDVFSLITDASARFGNGTKLKVLNEAGGREVVLFNELNAQLAHLQALYKHDEEFQKKLEILIEQHIKKQHSGQGIISKNAQIRACKIIKDVNIGNSAIISGAAELVNGTILSCEEDPARVGSNTILKDFIVQEGSQVNEGAILDHVFIGQSVKAGKNFSAENSLFFSNCEAFHSEACSIFAGPYTVTHHRSTLLIGSFFSFYNAGSGTNQSNHMYKLGPVHQGIFERGCKTGSFSYLLLESHIAAFSVVIGKHMTNIDIPYFPFSYLSEEQSKTAVMPGKNLFSIGTIRDGIKWPSRDRRKASEKRDLIIFDIFSPFTVEKMRIGREILKKLYDETPKESKFVIYKGIQISRLLLRKGVKYYTLAIDRYILNKLFTKIEQVSQTETSWKEIKKYLKGNKIIVNPNLWVDLSGLLALSERIDKIIQDVVEEKINTVDDLNVMLKNIFDKYPSDEWIYINFVFEQEYGFPLQEIISEKMVQLIDKWEIAATSLIAMVLADAKTEFMDAAKIGYGLYATEDKKNIDFQNVRGSLETNEVIKQCEQEGDEIKNRVAQLKDIISKIS